MTKCKKIEWRANWWKTWGEDVGRDRGNIRKGGSVYACDPEGGGEGDLEGAGESD